AKPVPYEAGGRRVTEGQLDRPRLKLRGAGRTQAGKTRCSPHHCEANVLDGSSKNGCSKIKKDVRQPLFRCQFSIVFSPSIV
ncbi:MAG: hypothetical protein II969_12930, partial [Anaerolineaceae bacterium]|nr:hypothetical protein [Anaerolineaceae bacterium]